MQNKATFDALENEIYSYFLMSEVIHYLLGNLFTVKGIWCSVNTNRTFSTLKTENTPPSPSRLG